MVGDRAEVGRQGGMSNPPPAVVTSKYHSRIVVTLSGES